MNTNGTIELDGIQLTGFQASILRSMPGRKIRSGKSLPCLPFFYLQKALKIQSGRSIHNLRSSVKSLAHKGLLFFDKERICMTENGLNAKMRLEGRSL